MAEQRLLFSLTAKDFKFETFCTGGAGGQHRNAKQNGVRCIHPPSGASAEHRHGRDQVRNKRAAFVKCVKSSEFMAWHRLEVARRLGHPEDTRTIDEIVEEQMAIHNLLIETGETATGSGKAGKG